jgi:hypothetical protein
MALTDRDVAVISKVLLTRLASSQATFLFARAFDPQGSDHWAKRLRVLYDAGWLSRFYLPQSRYLGGSPWPVYCVETGVAARAAALRTPWRALDRRVRVRLATESAAMRDRLLQLLTTSCGLAGDTARVLLRASTDLALKLYSGEPCQAQHTLLASSFAARMWHALATIGHAPADLRAVGSIDVHAAAGGERDIQILPDLFFLVGTTAVCVEAETGTSSRAKIVAKVERYLALRAPDRLAALAAFLGAPVAQLRVFFHCATPAHQRLIATVIAELAPGGTSLFLLSDAQTLHVDYRYEYFRRNHPIEGVPFYDALAGISERATFAQVEGADGRAAMLGYVSLREALVL